MATRRLVPVIVTQEVKQARPQSEIVAPDIDPGMLEYAATMLTSEAVSFRPVQFGRLLRCRIF